MRTAFVLDKRSRSGLKDRSLRPVALHMALVLRRSGTLEAGSFRDSRKLSSVALTACLFTRRKRHPGISVDLAVFGLFHATSHCAELESCA